MKTIEQLKAEHKKEISILQVKLQRAGAFENAGMPIPDYLADGKTYGAIGVAYWNRGAPLRSLSDAVELFKKFEALKMVSPFAVLKNGCTMMHPEAHLPAEKARGYKRDIGRYSSDYAVKLSVRHDAEHRNTSANLEFFAIVSGLLYSVCIDFGTEYIGNCSKLAPVSEIQRDARTDRIVSSKFKPNTIAFSLADNYLSFAYGGDPAGRATGADHRYLFVSDTEGDGAECSHAIGQLENLAGMIEASK